MRETHPITALALDAATFGGVVEDDLLQEIMDERPFKPAVSTLSLHRPDDNLVQFLPKDRHEVSGYVKLQYPTGPGKITRNTPDMMHQAPDTEIRSFPFRHE